MLRFGTDITGFNITFFISQSMDQLLIGKIFGAQRLSARLSISARSYEPPAYPIRVVTESALSHFRARLRPSGDTTAAS